jgi:hypothetical protein
MTLRYWIGAAALARSQSSANGTGGAGGGGVEAAVDGADCGGGDALGVAGTVTLALRLKACTLVTGRCDLEQQSPIWGRNDSAFPKTR